MLPDTPWTWYLEAKAWSVDLDDRHAQQSLNYANQNGKRWVVLSNGREWRLYDNQVQGVAADKLVASALLSAGADFREFLAAISKQTVASDGLYPATTALRLRRVLGARLQSPNSDVTRALHTAVRRLPGLSAVTPQMLVACLARLAGE